MLRINLLSINKNSVKFVNASFFPNLNEFFPVNIFWPSDSLVESANCLVNRVVIVMVLLRLDLARIY